MRGFDFNRLRGRAVVAINDAALSIPWATALFSLDVTWIENRRSVIAEFGPRAYLAVADDYDVLNLPVQANVYRRVRGDEGLNLNHGLLNMGGGNSGFGAFNLAVQKGARRIILMGYDLHASREHWHSGYQWRGKASQDALYRHWAEQYVHTIHTLDKLGICVFNACQHSLIDVFPKVSLDILPLDWMDKENQNVELFR